MLACSYELLMSEASALTKLDWGAMIVDEGHRLKNKDSKLVQELLHFK